MTFASIKVSSALAAWLKVYAAQGGTTMFKAAEELIARGYGSAPWGREPASLRHKRSSRKKHRYDPNK